MLKIMGISQRVIATRRMSYSGANTLQNGYYVNAALTCKLSTVAGTAFITNPSVDLRPFIGRKATLTSAGKTLVGWIKAAGTGETYTENWPLGNLEGVYTGGRCDFFSGGMGTPTLTESADTHSGIKAQSFASTTIATKINNTGTTPPIGRLYLYSMWAKRLSGTSNDVHVRFTELTVVDALNDVISTSSYSEHKKYYTATTTNTLQVSLRDDSGTGAGDTVVVDDFSLGTVLTPSTTGVTIVSTQGGSTYNWTSNDGIDPNATSFVLTISPN
jgi:hypothetical protein